MGSPSKVSNDSRSANSHRVSAPHRPVCSLAHTTNFLRFRHQPLRFGASWFHPYTNQEPTPISSAITTNVVTNRGAARLFIASATHCNVNKWPRDPLHKSRCFPKADSSIGDVSAASPYDEVVQRGAVTWEFMKSSCRIARLVRDATATEPAERPLWCCRLWLRARQCCLLHPCCQCHPWHLWHPYIP